MQQGGSQFGVSPEMTPFAAAGGIPEAASPISSRPPGAPPAGQGSFDELGPVMGSYQEDDSLAGEETERGVSGNRWPRQETLALLKIRSEMDAVFRDATLKGPLWEDVSRKLAELGYNRSAKKCKEKFENVHKYYKRTKEGRAGRQDGKSYRFFSQLEALHSSSNTITATPIAAVPPPPPPPAAAAPPNPLPAQVSVGVGGSNTMVGSSSRIQPPPPPVSSSPAIAVPVQINVVPQIGSDFGCGPTVVGGTTSAAAISFSSNTSSSASDSEDETEDGPPTMDTRKRKRSGSGNGGSGRKMMAFFEGLMKEVIEKQEAMQQRFLDAIEKREQDRMAREEAWKRQEMTRLAREHEIMIQERAMAASRDAAVIAFLQKMTGQTIQIAQPVLIPAVAATHHAPQPTQPMAMAMPPPPPPPQPQPQPQQHHRHHHPPQKPQQQTQQKQHHPPQHQSQNTEIIHHQPLLSSEIIVAQPEHQQEIAVGFQTTSPSRWPKSEVHALIKLRSGLETRYQEAGPKGPLWEEISAGMQRLGFKRSAKRCKEKWENINKYFKKVKESNKKRPEDAKTCPYFHQLDALYRKKLLSSSSTGGTQPKEEPETIQNQNQSQRSEILAIMPPPPPPPPPQPQPEAETKINANNNKGANTSGGSLPVPTSNGGGLPPSFLEEGPMKKPEDIVKELMEQRQQQQQSVMDDYDKLEEADSDNLDQEENDDEDDDDDDDDDDDEEEDEEEDRKMAYKIEFQKPNVGNSNGGGNAAASSFMAMVQKLSSS